MPLRKTLSRLAACLPPLLLLSACAYKIEIQQGNNALLYNLDKLQIGMTRADIEALLGPPQTLRLFRNNALLYSHQIRESGFLDSPKWVVVELTLDEQGRLSDIRTLRDDYDEEE